MAELPQGIEITWYGHACFAFTSPEGRRALIDPWVESQPQAVARNQEVGPLDVILISHGHFDHIGDAVAIAGATGAQVVCTPEIGAWLQEKGVKGEQIVGMNKGGTAEVQGFKIHMVHALHTGGIQDGNRIVYGGEPCGYVIEFSGGFRIYHASDTAVFSDMQLIGKLLHPDVAMLPIGDFFTMGPASAAEAIRLLGVKQVIPMHYGTFPVLTGTPQQLRQEAGDVPGLKVYEINPGDTIT